MQDLSSNSLNEEKVVFLIQVTYISYLSFLQFTDDYNYIP